jgi:hypothetical protein
MTTLAHLATNSLIITRLTTISGYKKDYTTTTGIRANVQPVSPEKTNLFNGVIGKTFIIYTDGVIDIQEGDKLRDTSTSEIYKVVNGGVSRRTFGTIDNLQIIVELIS